MSFSVRPHLPGSSADSCLSGGSIVADLLTNNALALSKDQVIAAVRSETQAEAVSQAGIRVLRLDLADPVAVLAAVLDNEGVRRAVTSEHYITHPY